MTLATGPASGTGPVVSETSSDSWAGWLQWVELSGLASPSALTAWHDALAARRSAEDPHIRALAQRLIGQAVVCWLVADGLRRPRPPGVAPAAAAVVTQFALDATVAVATPSPAHAAQATPDGQQALGELAATLAGIAHGSLAKFASAPQPADGVEATLRAMLATLERGYEAVADSAAFANCVAQGTDLWRGAAEGKRLSGAAAEATFYHPSNAPAIDRGERPAQGNAAPAQVAASTAELRDELTTLTRRLARHTQLAGGCTSSEPDSATQSVCWSHGSTTLRRLARPAGQSPAQPLLVVYSLVNHPSVLDLEADRSLLRRLSDAGFEVYWLDWHLEGETAPARSLDSYVTDLLRPALHAALDDAGTQSMAVLGICQGGTLSTCLAALEPTAVSALACLVTPLDFHTPDDRLSRWLRELEVQHLIHDDAGNAAPLPGTMAGGLFRLLNPSRTGSRRYFEMLMDPAATHRTLATRVRMERWLNAPPALGGQALADFLERFYQRNAFMAGRLCIDGAAVLPGHVRCPVLNVHARDDAIVPAASSAALGRLPAVPRYERLELPTGHVGALVGRRALAELPTALRRFLA